MKRTTATELRAWLDRQLELLRLERAAEIEETTLLLSNCAPELLQRNGLALLGLSAASCRTGIGGKTLVELERPAAYHVDQSFPPHLLRTGDLCRLGPYAVSSARSSAKGKTTPKAKDEKTYDGVISRVAEFKITISLGKTDAHEDELEIPERCQLVKLSNEATFDRLEKTLKELSSKLLSDNSDVVPSVDPLTSALLGLSEPNFETMPKEPPRWLDQNLNDSQKEAARFVLDEIVELGLIHGPPGTGKTQTLTEVIRQLVARGKSILVCGASNLAVDNLVERLAQHQVPLTRIGHPARVLDKLHHVTLDSQLAHSSAGAIVQDIKKEMDQIITELAKGKIRGKDRKTKWNEHKELRKECDHGHRVLQLGLENPDSGFGSVVLATCHGAGSRQLQGKTFDVVVIDEAAQALESACWIPILKGKKLILAGDPLQLPPTVKCKTPNLKSTSSHEGVLRPMSSLSETLFERLLTAYGPKLKRLLSVQYRMHEKIMQFPAVEMYEGKLKAAEGVKDRTLQDLVECPDDTLAEPIIFYDTAGTTMFERSDTEGPLSADSKSNENEAAILLRHIKELVKSGIGPACIAVISPYSAQAALLNAQLRPLYGSAIQVGTVDAFQGREAEVIGLSLVRSNDAKDVGFLADKRRLNVAMTRPRRQLVVIGDSETVSAGSAYLKRWMTFLEENAEVRLAGMLDM